ncbi:BUD13 homolog [Genypterus blacodes]|uniref:BUD13 homolog n=1 Tax=Genypterus blacodes TaxID=154954 RepID=UPI003F765D03
MAAFSGSSKAAELSKAEYLKRYLSADDDTKKSKDKAKKKRKKVPQRGLKIVDDDIDWRQMVTEDNEEEEDEEEAPVIAEVIDERPDDIKQLEAFRTSNRWKVIGADENEVNEEEETESGHQQPATTSTGRHDSPDVSPRRSRNDSPGRKTRHDSPDISPPRRGRHDSPDLSPPRPNSGSSELRKKTNSSQKRSPDSKNPKRHDSDSDQSPPRKRRGAADSGKSPQRKTNRNSDCDQSPPRRRPQGGKASDEDLSPPRRQGQPQGPRMLSGGTAGLVSKEVLRNEREENKRRDRHNKPLEDESRTAQTTFRDKSGKRRDLESEREEQKRKAGEKAAKDEKYAQWGRGLAQGQMQQQKLEDAVHEAQKPLARHRDDEDLDRMLREQEREGDPMAAMLRRKKDRSSKAQGGKVKPQYKGPLPPPNRFNLPPGYRWDGVDRSNGFEQKRYARLADKQATQETAYKWSVEDM